MSWPTSSKPPQPPTPAERWFRLGAQLVREERYHEALSPLEQALSYSVESPDAPFLRTLRSHYGLTIAMTRGDVRRGRRLCEEAILRGPFDPHLYANLARLYLRAQRKDLAAQTVATALRLAPEDRELTALAGRIGLRREPIFSFLERSHPLNRLVGKLRHRLGATWQHSRIGASSADLRGYGSR